MNAARTFIRKNSSFLWSLGAHVFIFSVLAIKDHKKSNDSAVDIELRENIFSELNQKSSKSETKKSLRSDSKTAQQIQQTAFDHDKESQDQSERVVQQIAGQVEENEGFSDISNKGNSNQNYLDRIRSKIEFHKTYPKASRVLKETGLVQVKLKISKSGHVQKIEIAKPSQFKRLDEAAIKAVADASPFDEFPTEVKFATWSILVPMRFELN